ncbi:MAG TPA: RNA polymerase Rpb4 family protein [Methanomassiliicoccales archaeon]|nr:RNA polymerase Rpb4 family protein [Methanomassiliicoccales archaeon]
MSEDRPITLAEVKELLEDEQKKRPELTPEQKVSLDHAGRMARLTSSQANKLKKDLKELGFVPDMVIVKVVDILPEYPEDVRALFAKERLILDKKQIDALLAAVKKYI